MHRAQRRFGGRPWLSHLALGALLVAAGLAPVTVGFAQPPAQVVIQQIDASGYPTVSLILDVLDATSLPIEGIRGGEVQISEQGHAVSGVSIAPATEAGLNLAVTLAIDVSGSMQGPPLDRAKAAATEFVNRLAPQDQAMVLSFGSQVRQVQGFTADKELLRRAISSLVAAGNTKLYDALYISAEETAKTPLRRKVVVLLSDGDDTASAKPLEEGIGLAQGRGVLVFPIGVGAAPSNILRRIASETGGVSLTSPTPAELGQAYETLSKRLRSAYLLTYTAPRYVAPPDRALRVTVDHDRGAASAEGLVRVDFAPLRVTVQGLPQTVAGGAEIAVEIDRPSLAAEVRYAVDDRAPTSVAGPPFVFTFESGGLAGEFHTLRVEVQDIIERTGRQDGRFQVRAPSPPQPRAWLVALNYMRENPLTLVALVAVLSSSAAFVGHLVGFRRGVHCPACGSRHGRREECPVCGPRTREYVQPLGQMLVRASLITPAQLERAVTLGREEGRRLGEVLTASQVVDRELLHRALQIQARSTTYALRYQRLSDESDEELPFRAGLLLFGGLTVAGLLLFILPIIRFVAVASP